MLVFEERGKTSRSKNQEVLHLHQQTTQQTNSLPRLHDSSDSSQVDQWNLLYLGFFCEGRGMGGGGGGGEGGKKGGNGVCESSVTLYQPVVL